MLEEIDLLSEEMVEMYIELGICQRLKKKVRERLSDWERAIIYREQIADKGFKRPVKKSELEYLIDKELSWNNGEKPLGV